MSAAHRLLITTALFTLAGCAGVERSLDGLASRVDARSNCHTSTGDWVGGPGCSVSYAVSSTSSTTTTVVTTTTTPAPPPPSKDD